MVKIKSIFRSFIILLVTVLIFINGLYLYSQYRQGTNSCLPDTLAIIGNGSKSQPNSLIQAQEDIERLMRGKTPSHSVFYAALSDGGSAVYKGKNYEIVEWKKITSVDGIHGFIRGFSVQMTDQPGNGGSYSHTWFEAAP